MTTITLRHASPTRNRIGISMGGLLVSCATGKIKAVWLHAAGHSLAAVEHVARRHSVEPRDVSVYPVTLSLTDPRLKKCSKSGWFYYVGDVGLESLGRPARAKDMLYSDPWGQDAKGGEA